MNDNNECLNDQKDEIDALNSIYEDNIEIM